MFCTVHPMVQAVWTALRGRTMAQARMEYTKKMHNGSDYAPYCKAAVPSIYVGTGQWAPSQHADSLRCQHGLLLWQGRSGSSSSSSKGISWRLLSLLLCICCAGRHCLSGW